MQILSVLPGYSGEWISVTDALPPPEASVFAAGSRLLSDGTFERIIEKAYCRKENYDEMTSQYNWYITGRDAYSFERVTDWMVSPPLPEQMGEAALTYQYTPESCPGHPCAEQCDHRGLPPEVFGHN